ncbi:hypothetical protein NM688_g1233 [Phlebia brevispora]|uniref:Uncharacterized protein n=1 Tax=Phlebia brevispora TaxID=194682 RepID=A0ACC1TC67_9APHY|nr:hypothetical protein NM688_g1233 [Phlebia brevispora]
MVTRQPPTFVLTAPMPRSQRFRHIVAKYCTRVSHSRRRPRIAESIEVPPTPPPKDEIHEKHPVKDLSLDLQDMQHEYAAHIVFLTQATSSTHDIMSQPSHPIQPQSRSPPPAKAQPYPQLPASVVLPRMLSVPELKRRREEVARRSLVAAMHDDQEEEVWQQRQRHEKEVFWHQLEEEEKRRKLQLEKELRYVALIKRMKEDQERREDEERRKALEERRATEQARRRQQAQDFEEWRKEQARRAQDEARQRMEKRSNVVARRRMGIARLNNACSDTPSSEFDCWLTMQAADSIVWRRRFARIHGSTMTIYKDALSSQLIATLNFREVQDIKEWEDGCEELEGLPFSFCMKMHDGAVWTIFTDNQEEKGTLLVLVPPSATFSTLSTNPLLSLAMSQTPFSTQDNTARQAGNCRASRNDGLGNLANIIRTSVPGTQGTEVSIHANPSTPTPSRPLAGTEVVPATVTTASSQVQLQAGSDGLIDVVDKALLAADLSLAIGTDHLMSPAPAPAVVEQEMAPPPSELVAPLPQRCHHLTALPDLTCEPAHPRAAYFTSLDDIFDPSSNPVRWFDREESGHVAHTYDIEYTQIVSTFREGCEAAVLQGSADDSDLKRVITQSLSPAPTPQSKETLAEPSSKRARTHTSKHDDPDLLMLHLPSGSSLNNVRGAETLQVIDAFHPLVTAIPDLPLNKGMRLSGVLRDVIKGVSAGDMDCHVKDLDMAEAKAAKVKDEPSLTQLAITATQKEWAGSNSFYEVKACIRRCVDNCLVVQMSAHISDKELKELDEQFKLHLDSVQYMQLAQKMGIVTALYINTVLFYQLETTDLNFAEDILDQLMKFNRELGEVLVLNPTELIIVDGQHRMFLVYMRDSKKSAAAWQSHSNASSAGNGVIWPSPATLVQSTADVAVDLTPSSITTTNVSHDHCSHPPFCINCSEAHKVNSYTHGVSGETLQVGKTCSDKDRFMPAHSRPISLAGHSVRGGHGRRSLSYAAATATSSFCTKDPRPCLPHTLRTGNPFAVLADPIPGLGTEREPYDLVSEVSTALCQAEPSAVLISSSLDDLYVMPRTAVDKHGDTHMEGKSF